MARYDEKVSGEQAAALYRQRLRELGNIRLQILPEYRQTYDKLMCIAIDKRRRLIETDAGSVAIGQLDEIMKGAKALLAMLGEFDG